MHPSTQTDVHEPMSAVGVLNEEATNLPQSGSSDSHFNLRATIFGVKMRRIVIKPRYGDTHSVETAKFRH